MQLAGSHSVSKWNANAETKVLLERSEETERREGGGRNERKIETNQWHFVVYTTVIQFLFLLAAFVKEPTMNQV